MTVIWKSIRTTNITLKIDSNYWQYSEKRFELMTVFWNRFEQMPVIWNRFELMTVIWKSIWTYDSDLKIDLN